MNPVRRDSNSIDWKCISIDWNFSGIQMPIQCFPLSGLVNLRHRVLSPKTPNFCSHRGFSKKAHNKTRTIYKNSAVAAARGRGARKPKCLKEQKQKHGEGNGKRVTFPRSGALPKQISGIEVFQPREAPGGPRERIQRKDSERVTGAEGGKGRGKAGERGGRG